MPALELGIGRRDISPELGVRLGGYGVKERPCESIHDPLHSTSLVLVQDETQAAIINLDWIGIDANGMRLVRDGVHEQTGIPKEHITVSTIHTHTAPFTLNLNGWGEFDRGYVESVIPLIIESVVDAQASLQPVRMGVGTIPSDVGVNRRSINEEHSTDFTGDPHRSYDPTMTVLRFEGSDGPVATVAHYGAHPTAWGMERVASRDWVGVMKDRLEDQTGAPSLFINGALGDIGPRTNVMTGDGFSAGTGDGVHAVNEVGYRAATDALRTWASIKDFIDEPQLDLWVEEMDLPYRPMPELAEAKRELKAHEAGKDEWGPGMCDYCYWKDVVQILESGNIKTKSVFQQTITRIGPVALVPGPGELFSGITLRIRRYSPFQYTLCASATNGWYSYCPTREAIHRGGYEVWVGRASGAYLLAEDIDDHLVEQNVAFLRKLYEHL